jgi:uncharacterized protein YbgA (DUF1722 family)
MTVRLDLGWHLDERVGMFSGEAYVSHSRELLALEVHPSKHYDHLGDFLGAAQRWQEELVRSVFDPDPF